MEDFPKREEAFIAAVRKGIVPRKGWEEAFREMATNGDDFLLLPDVPTVWEREKWEWQ
jgi:hypothetical protein